MEKETKRYVYILKHPITKEIKYVGQTNNPRRRFYAHYSTKKKTHTSDWVFDLRKDKMRPIMEIVFETDSIIISREKEKELIQYYLDNGINLTNAIGGGELGIFSSEYLPNNSTISFDDFLRFKNILETESLSILQLAKKYNVSKQSLYRLSMGELYNHKFGKYKVIRPKNIFKASKNNKNKHFKDSKYIIECNSDGYFKTIYNSISHLKENKKIGLNLNKIFNEYSSLFYKNSLYIATLEYKVFDKIDVSKIKNLFNYKNKLPINKIT